MSELSKAARRKFEFLPGGFPMPKGSTLVEKLCGEIELLEKSQEKWDWLKNNLSNFNKLERMGGTYHPSWRLSVYVLQDGMIKEKNFDGTDLDEVIDRAIAFK